MLEDIRVKHNDDSEKISVGVFDWLKESNKSGGLTVESLLISRCVLSS